MLIIAEKVGQLGNRLLLYSNVIAYAIEHNLTVVNPSFAEYASLFETTHQDLLCRYPANRFFLGNSLLLKKLFIIEDMYSLAECDYIIGPPSTYTMWASFYGEVPLYMVDNPSLKPVLSDFKFY